MIQQARPEPQVGLCYFRHWGLLVLATLAWLLCALPLRAHEGLALPPPITEGDAWNMLSACQRNLGSLLAEQRWSEMPIQASLSIQALRYLREQAPPAHPTALGALLQAEDQARFVYQVAEREDPERTVREFASYEQLLHAVEPLYPATVRQAAVYTCPMCKGVREFSAEARCPECGMSLVPRVIPASAFYNAPGATSLTLSTTLSTPLAVGRESQVTLDLKQSRDGRPVEPRDLLVMHTERIHLLIVDATLRDYHHIHPQEGPVPGRYLFPFKPRLPGPYLIFADVVLAATNAQEYVRGTLGSQAAPPAVEVAPANYTVEVEGYRYRLAFSTGEKPLRARQAIQATVEITEAATGQPCIRLEPLMGAFAHLVGFHQDRETVLHLHPLGAEPQRSEERGGPTYTVQFFAPKPGYYRLYSQVQIGGRSHFAPFDVIVGE